MPATDDEGICPMMRQACTQPAPASPPWRAQLDEVAQVLAEARMPREAPPRVRAALAAAIAEAGGPALSGDAVARLAVRVSRLLAA